jgi:hypothetical protein
LIFDISATTPCARPPRERLESISAGRVKVGRLRALSGLGASLPFLDLLGPQNPQKSLYLLIFATACDRLPPIARESLMRPNRQSNEYHRQKIPTPSVGVLSPHFCGMGPPKILKKARIC